MYPLFSYVLLLCRLFRTAWKAYLVAYRARGRLCFGRLSNAGELVRNRVGVDNLANSLGDRYWGLSSAPRICLKLLDFALLRPLWCALPCEDLLRFVVLALFCEGHFSWKLTLVHSKAELHVICPCKLLQCLVVCDGGGGWCDPFFGRRHNSMVPAVAGGRVGWPLVHGSPCHGGRVKTVDGLPVKVARLAYRAGWMTEMDGLWSRHVLPWRGEDRGWSIRECAHDFPIVQDVVAAMQK
ncbi:hypothetical protein CRG98_012094 [Punica granatum]|uniref:Uncharacterized protein n=1 Tax=Punica granatum TaxID=22663 RepID=A0A2I0KGS9_PUNGR|nr:hypothetical protein CRG98_012094 [Punica granatum]